MAFIQVYNIIIDPNDISGIGPLVRLQQPSVEDHAFKQVEFYFDLFTYHGHIRVTTNMMSFIGQGKGLSEQHFKCISETQQHLADNILFGYDRGLGLPPMPSHDAQPDQSSQADQTQ